MCDIVDSYRFLIDYDSVSVECYNHSISDNFDIILEDNGIHVVHVCKTNLLHACGLLESLIVPQTGCILYAQSTFQLCTVSELGFCNPWP